MATHVLGRREDQEPSSARESPAPQVVAAAPDLESLNTIRSMNQQLQNLSRSHDEMAFRLGHLQQFTGNIVRNLDQFQTVFGYQHKVIQNIISNMTDPVAGPYADLHLKWFSSSSHF